MARTRFHGLCCDGTGREKTVFQQQRNVLIRSRRCNEEISAKAQQQRFKALEFWLLAYGIPKPTIKKGFSLTVHRA